RVLALLLVLVLAWPAFLLWDGNRHLGRTDALDSGTGTPGTTYLLAGSDSRADGAVQDGTEGQRADSIMLVNVAPNGQASATSLPRDTYVDIPGYGWGKLNASYSYGGAQLLVSTVESLTGLHIDHFVEIGMGGVGEIVDAVGGVELCLDMDVNDSYSGLVWQSGCHEADGTTALAFSRMRYSDPLGDIGRAQRQRQVVEKTVSAAMSPSVLLNPLKAFRLERAGAGALTVDEDSNIVDVARLVMAFRKAGNASLTGAPPIESLGYQTSAGSTVLLQDQTAPDFFRKVLEGTLTPADMEQSF
ncbi:LCP family protein, partial [Actinomyces polynesiensis]|uniref:LCP family protein n=1 Tax=Actinomyces polynesiensis TaxID=1325934 RepID=UPI0005BB7C53